MQDFQVTIIFEDGMILKEKAKFIEKKTVLQILQIYHRDNIDNYILAIRTPTVVNILPPDIHPLQQYPELKAAPNGEEFSIPKLSLCFLEKKEEYKNLFVFQPIAEDEENIQFPQFVYGFEKKDLTKPLSAIKTDMVKFFGLDITNPKLFLDQKEITNCLGQRFIDTIRKSPNLKTIYFKFTLSDKGYKKIRDRQHFCQEMIEVEQKFCSDIIQFLNQVGKNVQEAHVFTEFEHKTIFGSIPEMFEACTRCNTALSGNITYNSYIGNIFLKYIPDLEENFKEFFANYHNKELIPEILKRHKNNQTLESIVHQTFGKEAMSFDSMAIMPIQILPRYKLIIGSIIKETPRSHPEFHLLQNVLIELDKSINKLEDYGQIREVSYLQKRMIPLEEYQDQRLDVNERFLVNKYNVNASIISKSTLYLLNDMVVMTKTTDSREMEKFRIKLDQFIFIPNYYYSSIILYFKKQYEVIKFSSSETLKDFLTNLNKNRQKVFNNHPEKKNSLLSSEILIEQKINIPKVIDCSCCKIKTLITSASYGSYITYDTNNQSLNAFQMKNIHTHAKIVNTENCSYEHIYGGERYPIPLEFTPGKFIELKNKPTTSNSQQLPYFVECQMPNEGKIHHTVCHYKNFIVIYGGTDRRNQKFSSDIYFVDSKTGFWYHNRPGIDQEPEPRYMHSAVVYKNLMVIHGGISCRDGSILSDTWSFDFIDGKWKNVNFNQKNIIVPRFGHTAVMVKQFMFIFGGLTYKTLNDQISLEKSKSKNFSLDNFLLADSTDNDTVGGEEDATNSDDDDLNTSSISNNNQYSGASNCFSINLEYKTLFCTNIIGNYLPGLVMSSACYDDHNEEIIILGGRYQNNKYEKYSPIFLKMAVPTFFTASTTSSDEIISIGCKLARKRSHGLIKVPNCEPVPHPGQCSASDHAAKDSRPKIKPQPSTPCSKKVGFPKLKLNDDDDDDDDPKLPL